MVTIIYHRIIRPVVVVVFFFVFCFSMMERGMEGVGGDLWGLFLFNCVNSNPQISVIKAPNF